MAKDTQILRNLEGSSHCQCQSSSVQLAVATRVLTDIAIVGALYLLNLTMPPSNNHSVYLSAYWARGNVVVKALCHKLEGRGFDTR
jgi:hypothetical protein